MSENLNSIYNFNRLRLFLRHWIDHNPSGRWGQISLMAEAIGISSSMLSLVLKGEKNLSAEQALSLSQHLILNDAETDYFCLLADFERAGSAKLKQRIQKKIESAQIASRQIKNRVQVDKELNEQAKSIYYSHWYYTGIRNLVAIDGIDSAQDIAKHLDLSPQIIQRVIEFLLESGLCKRVDGKLTYGFTQTHVDSQSPFVTRHHQNWRQRGFVKMEKMDDEDLFFTSPMSLSVEATREIRKLIPTLIEKVQKTAGPSTSEVAMCLNIDWFEY